MAPSGLDMGDDAGSAMVGGRSLKTSDVAKPRPLDLRPCRVNKSAMIRDDIKSAQLAAMKSGDKESRNAISLIQAAIKNRDIEERTGQASADDDALVVEVLQKMVKQRRESIDMFRKGAREELALAEEAEVAVIERFLPTRLTDEETSAAIETIKADLGASGMKDMGRVMAELKARHAVSLDMSKASGLVKAALA